jgi:N-acetylglutamate synthase-like GNAT family acetyltransferase
LKAANLTEMGLESSTGMVLEKGGDILAHIATEATPEGVLVRSLVVAQGLRGKGYGRKLLEAVEGAAGPLPVVLRSDTIGDWVQRRGYVQVSPSEVPETIRASTQFSLGVCDQIPVFIRRP